MKNFNGIKDVLSNLNNLPDVGWLFVKNDFDRSSAEDIKTKPIMLAQNDEDEDLGLKIYRNWLEAPTLTDIIFSKKANNPEANIDDFVEAIIFYLENDSFIDDL